MKIPFISDKKLNILVLGSDGMLGHEVYNCLAAEANMKKSIINKVVGFDIKDNIDLTNHFLLSTKLSEYIQFDYCINCVAYTDTKGAETYEGKIKSYELNALAPKVIADVCEKFGIKLIHISTDYVFSEKSPSCWPFFDSNMPHPVYEDSTPFPIGNYGTHKLIGETNIISSFKKHPHNFAILRVSWLYGAHNNKSFIHKFLRNVILAMKDGKDIVNMVDDEISVPTSVRFVFVWIMLVLRNNLSGTIHAVPNGYNNNGVSRYEFAEQILNCLCGYVNTHSNAEWLKEINGIKLEDFMLNSVSSNSEYQPHFSTLSSSLYHADLNEKFTYCKTWTDCLYDFFRLHGKDVVEYLKTI